MTTTDAAPRRRGWRKRGSSDGAMSLFEHLAELQVRLFRSALAVAAGATVGWIFYKPLFALIQAPIDPVIRAAKDQGRDVILAVGGVTDALTLKIEVAFAAGIILALPVWLYQLWRFIAPGLHGVERKWAYLFAAAATPLFLVGAGFGYLAMPKLLESLLGLTPDSVENIVQIDTYLAFVLQILLFFGVGFLIPLIFVMLNLANILTGRKFFAQWRWIVLGSFLFGAIATPTGDPFWMTLTALPLLLLLGLAGLLMLTVDGRRSRRRRREGLDPWDDDEVSPLPPDDVEALPIHDDIT